MCLITTQKKASIAKEDILVFKLLSPTSSFDAKSPFHEHTYSLYKRQDTVITEDTDWTTFDEIDIRWLDTNYPNWCEGENSELKCFGQGFHSAISYERLVDRYAFIDTVYECIIPAGSEYYKNDTGLVISNAIIVIRIHVPEDLEKEPVLEEIQEYTPY